MNCLMVSSWELVTGLPEVALRLHEIENRKQSPEVFVVQLIELFEIAEDTVKPFMLILN